MPNLILVVPIAQVLSRQTTPPIYVRDHSDVYMFLRQVEDVQHYYELVYEYKLTQAHGGYDYDW